METIELDLWWGLYLAGALLFIGTGAEQIDLTRKQREGRGMTISDGIVVLCLSACFWWALVIVDVVRGIKYEKTKIKA